MNITGFVSNMFLNKTIKIDGFLKRSFDSRKMYPLTSSKKAVVKYIFDNIVIMGQSFFILFLFIKKF